MGLKEALDAKAKEKETRDPLAEELKAKDIPKQLKEKGVRFIRVKTKDKLPLDDEWQKTNNFAEKDEELRSHLNGGGNYGVLCGGGLIVIDADSKELNDIMINSFPKTFVVNTSKSWKNHYYYWCIGFNKKKVLKKNGIKLGEIQSTGSFVVGAGSTHPSGIKYEIVDDIEIADINSEDIDKVLGDCYSNERINKEIILKGAESGVRNDSLFRLACSFREKDLTENEAFLTLKSINEKNNPPLSEVELSKIIESAYSYTKGITKGKFGAKDDSIEKIRNQVYTKLATKKPREATEIIVKYILSKEHIHTTRDDEKSEMWIYQEGIFIPEGKTYIKETSRTILEEGYTKFLTNEIIAKIETETFIEQNEFFKVENIKRIAVQNGIVDLMEKKLCPFTPEEKHFNKLPIIYDDSKECPIIKKHLSNILQSKNDVPVLQELFGYLLYREYKIEKAFMFTGSGRNGKGKTLELMKRFLGIENCSNITLQHIEGDSFAMGELFNKLANLGGDISRTALKETGHFKNLTGRDLISAARKFKTRVNFTNYAKMIFCANELPITYDITTAFFNRWILLEFPFTFLSQKELNALDENEKENKKLADPEIIDKLSSDEELSGLLNWAIEGLHRMLKQGDFSYSPSTKEVKNKWVRMSDSATAFLLDSVEEEYGLYIKKADLRFRYNQYCKKHKIKPRSDRSLKTTLEINFGVTDGRHSLDGEMCHCWEGIKFKINRESISSNIDNEEHPQDVVAESVS